jgi:hypothetical protein
MLGSILKIKFNILNILNHVNFLLINKRQAKTIYRNLTKKIFFEFLGPKNTQNPKFLTVGSINIPKIIELNFK